MVRGLLWLWLGVSLAGPPGTGISKAGGGAGSDTTAIHTDGTSEIGGLTAVSLYNGGDVFVTEQSGAKKKYTLTQLADGIGAMVNDVGVLADLQSDEAACQAGWFGTPTDATWWRLDCLSDGVWSYRHVNSPFYSTLPPSSGWTALNSGSVAASYSGRLLSAPAEVYTGNGWRGEYRAQPSDPTTTPYYAQAAIVVPHFGTAANMPQVMFGFTDATGLAVIRVGGNGNIAASRYATVSGTATDDATLSATLTGSVIWLRVEEDGSNRYFYVRDPTGGWVSVGSASGYGRTVTITATSIVWGAYSGDVDLSIKPYLISYEAGAL